LDEASGKVFRIHQEDFCQATGVAPSQKYQADGGPGLTKIMSILEGGASPELDRQRFVQALILNYVLLGIDAHAKNFSLLIDHDGFRLAPLYDVISATPYDTKKYSKLAMSVGDEYRWRWIQARHWAKFCDEAKFPLEDFRQEMLRQAAEVPAAAAATLRDCARDGLDTQLLMKLVPALQSRCLDVETHAKMI
jgi:serine/threonine-protein kinase HipA